MDVKDARAKCLANEVDLLEDPNGIYDDCNVFCLVSGKVR
jgi:hypothetical protein